MRRRPEEAEETRQALLDAAMKVFLTRGYPDSRIEDIAETAGVTRGAFYHHFKGKQEVFYALLEERYAPAMGLLEGLYADVTKPPLRQIELFFSGYLGLLGSDARFREANELVLFKTTFVPELEAGRQAKVQGIRATLVWLRDRIAEAQLRGEAAPALDAALAAFSLYGSLTGLVSLWLLDPEGFPLPERAQELAALALSPLERPLGGT